MNTITYANLRDTLAKRLNEGKQIIVDFGKHTTYLLKNLPQAFLQHPKIFAIFATSNSISFYFLHNFANAIDKEITKAGYPLKGLALHAKRILCLSIHGGGIYLANIAIGRVLRFPLDKQTNVAISLAGIALHVILNRGFDVTKNLRRRGKKIDTKIPEILNNTISSKTKGSTDSTSSKTSTTEQPRPQLESPETSSSSSTPKRSGSAPNPNSGQQSPQRFNREGPQSSKNSPHNGLEQLIDSDDDSSDDDLSSKSGIKAVYIPPESNTVLRSQKTSQSTDSVPQSKSATLAPHATEQNNSPKTTPATTKSAMPTVTKPPHDKGEDAESKNKQSTVQPKTPPTATHATHATTEQTNSPKTTSPQAPSETQPTATKAAHGKDEDSEPENEQSNSQPSTPSTATHAPHATTEQTNSPKTTPPPTPPSTPPIATKATHTEEDAKLDNAPSNSQPSIAPTATHAIHATTEQTNSPKTTPTQTPPTTPPIATMATHGKEKDDEPEQSSSQPSTPTATHVEPGIDLIDLSDKQNTAALNADKSEKKTDNINP